MVDHRRQGAPNSRPRQAPRRPKPDTAAEGAPAPDRSEAKKPSFSPRTDALFAEAARLAKLDPRARGKGGPRGKDAPRTDDRKPEGRKPDGRKPASRKPDDRPRDDRQPRDRKSGPRPERRERSAPPVEAVEPAPTRRPDPSIASFDSRPSGLADQAVGERVAKALARAGVASRREVERYIADGRVAVNGKVLDSPAVKIDAGDVLTVDGAVVNEAEPTRLWRYHKPVGLLTTHQDPNGRPTVFENLPKELPRVISVGRLDLASEGLLLLTNDGALARALEMPKSGWIRQYRVRAFGRTSQVKLDELAKGVTVEGVVYGPVHAKLDKVARTESVGGSNVWITVSISEGKNREVRRVLESVGLKVNRLIRLAYGPFALGTLPVSAVEEVGPRVIRELLTGFIAPENMPRGDRPVGPLLIAPGASRIRRMPDRPGTVAAPPGEARPASRTAAPAAPAAAPAAPKKAYKAGWAKPSIRPKGPVKPGGKPGPKPGPKSGARAGKRPPKRP
jgi:23S rRNA pseudouridine2605 synthase